MHSLCFFLRNLNHLNHASCNYNSLIKSDIQYNYSHILNYISLMYIIKTFFNNLKGSKFSV